MNNCSFLRRLQNTYLLVLSECHHVLDHSHPYWSLLGPPCLQYFTSAPSTDVSSKTPEEEFSTSSDGQLPPDEREPPTPRIVCFTSALIPQQITDPIEVGFSVI